MSDKNKKPYKFEYDAFQKFIKGKSLSFLEIFILFVNLYYYYLKDLLEIFQGQ